MGRAVSTMKCPMLLSSGNTKSLALSCVKNFLPGISIWKPIPRQHPGALGPEVSSGRRAGRSLPLPHKEPGEAGPDPGRSALHGLHPQGAGAGSPPPRRPPGPSAALPAAASLVPSAPAPQPARPVLLTSARAASGPCTAAGCGCSCWADAGGSLFRWLRSSSGTAPTPVGPNSSASSRSRSSRGADARPLPRAAAAAIPPAETATHGRRRRKCGRWEASTPSRPRRASLSPRRRLVRNQHHAGSGKGGREA